MTLLRAAASDPLLLELDGTSCGEWGPRRETQLPAASAAAAAAAVRLFAGSRHGGGGGGGKSGAKGTREGKGALPEGEVVVCGVGITERAVEVPVPAGRYTDLVVTAGALFYVSWSANEVRGLSRLSVPMPPAACRLLPATFASALCTQQETLANPRAPLTYRAFSFLPLARFVQVKTEREPGNAENSYTESVGTAMKLKVRWGGTVGGGGRRGGRCGAAAARAAASLLLLPLPPRPSSSAHIRPFVLMLTHSNYTLRCLAALLPVCAFAPPFHGGRRSGASRTRAAPRSRPCSAPT